MLHSELTLEIWDTAIELPKCGTSGTILNDNEVYPTHINNNVITLYEVSIPKHVTRGLLDNYHKYESGLIAAQKAFSHNRPHITKIQVIVEKNIFIV